MSALSENERLGLEEVFLSISKNHKKSHKLSLISSIKLKGYQLLPSKERVHALKQLSKNFSKSLKMSKNSHFFKNFWKKKKSLS